MRQQDSLDVRRSMHEFLKLGDYSTAMDKAHTLLMEQPEDHEAHQVIQRCETWLMQHYLGQLGPLSATPMLKADVDVRWLGLTDTELELISMIDGTCTWAEILHRIHDQERLASLRALLALKKNFEYR